MDIVAIRFKCCGEYFPCHLCHAAVADHMATPWALSEFDTKAVLCGVCKNELTIQEYMCCGFACPVCGSAFNPGCALHYNLYFETPEVAESLK